MRAQAGAAGHADFCPVAKTAEVFAQRWTPVLLRELLCGVSRFNDLCRSVPLMSRALLAQRLKELEHAGIVVMRPREDGPGHDYHLTPAGLAFRPVLEAMSHWGQTWGQGRVGRNDVNATQLLWAIRHHADYAALPERPMAVRFEFRGVRRGETHRRIWWLVLRPGAIDVCVKYPGFAEDVVVRADLEAFTRVWLGYRGCQDAVAAGAVAFAGSGEEIAAFRRCIGVFDEPTEKEFRFAPIPA